MFVSTTVIKLQEFGEQVHFSAPLANALLSGIKRFERLLKDEACQLVTAFHPKFRLVWLQKEQQPRVEEVLIKEREREVNEKDSISISGSSNNEAEGGDFYSTVAKSE